MQLVIPQPLHLEVLDLEPPNDRTADRQAPDRSARTGASPDRGRADRHCANANRWAVRTPREQPGSVWSRPGRRRSPAYGSGASGTAGQRGPPNRNHNRVLFGAPCVVDPGSPDGVVPFALQHEGTGRQLKAEPTLEE